MLADAPDAGHREICAELGTATLIHTGNWKLVYDPEEGGVTHLYNMRRDPQELDNLAGAAGYEATTAQLIERLLAHRIRLTQYTHAKEEQRVQQVRLGS
jgi:arylsulfatase A-like enzyme